MGLQARMSSSRLPGKVLKRLGDAGPVVLDQVIERIKHSRLVDDLFLLTSDDVSDDLLAFYGKDRCLPVLRGSMNDVLSRYVELCRKVSIEHQDFALVRVTADCPLLDPSLLDEMIYDYKNHDWDYFSNTISRSYPDGFDLEIFNSKVIDFLDCHALSSLDREHVTSLLHRYSQGLKIGQKLNDLDLSKYRVTLDTQTDLNILAKIFGENSNSIMNASEVARWLEGES